jgi:hypothetical protein
MRTGNILIIIGAVLVVLGVLVRFVPGLFAWFGHLPGDVLIEGENSKVFIPFNLNGRGQHRLFSGGQSGGLVLPVSLTAEVTDP